MELKPKDITIFTPDRNKLNLLDSEKCFKAVLDLKPDWIINAGAYTNVEEAESNKELAIKTNVNPPLGFSKALKITGGKLLQISTDYVFDGNQSLPYTIESKKDLQ